MSNYNPNANQDDGSCRQWPQPPSNWSRPTNIQNSEPPRSGWQGWSQDSNARTLQGGQYMTCDNRWEIQEKGLEKACEEE